MKNNKNKNSGSQLRGATRTLSFVFAILFTMTAFSHFCFALTSENYKIIDDIVASGGEKSTSTNYSIIQSYVGDTMEVFTYNVGTGAGDVTGGEGVPSVPPVPTPPADTTAPIISNIIVSNITENSAVISWTTNENGSTNVDYGKLASYELGTTSGAGNTTTHEITISGLLASTTHHFRVRSSDNSGNEAQSLDQTFTTASDTTVPVISNITVTNIGGNTATINWETSEPSTSAVNFGKTASYGAGAKTSAELTNIHSIVLTDLDSATLYHFIVKSADSANNPAFSSDQTFTTLDTTAPIISGVRAKNITSDTAEIEWFTNEIASGSVNYGLTAGYEAGINISGAFSTGHQLPLSSLIGNTLYHFRVTATDPMGNTSNSVDFTFTTERDEIPPSNVLNFTAEPGETYILLNWMNPTDADFKGVHIMRGDRTYPRSPEEGMVVFHGLADSTVDRGLTPGTLYYYTAFSYDTSENFGTGAIASATTLGAKPEVPPEEIPPEEIPEEIILPEKPAIQLSQILFLVAEEKLELPVINDNVTTVIGAPLLIAIPLSNLSQKPESIILKVGDSTYLLAFNPGRQRYETRITSPVVFGGQKSSATIIYSATNIDFIEFSLTALNPGLVYEIFEGAEKAVNEAQITLYRQNESTNQWVIWDSSRFGEPNPFITQENGNYYFLAPNGTYYISASKDGYRLYESAVMNLTGIIINRNIELLKIPPKLEEIINIEAPLAENIQNVAEYIREQAVYNTKISRDEIVKIIDNPRVEEANTQIAVPAVATAVVANAGAAISFINLFNYLRFLFTQPFLLLERKKRKGWGSVYHAFSKLPVDLAIVRLIDAKTKKILQTRVTDRQGRYAFIVSEGNYLLEVKKSGFIFPSKYLKKIARDAGMSEIYHGEIIKVSKESATITANIPLDPVEKAAVPKKIIIKKILQKINRAVAVSGVILALVSLIISPTILLGGLFAGQIILYVLFRRLATTKKPKTWGIVYDKKTRRPLRYAIARIFETEYNKLLETQVTDARGRYVFLVGRGNYYATFEKKLYETRKTDKIDLTKARKENIIALDIGLNKAS